MAIRPVGRRWRLVAVLALLVGLLPAAPSAAQTNGTEMVLSGLNNPRGLTFNGDTLYVAEAGKGGDGSCLPDPEGGEMCFGETGAIVALADAPDAVDIEAETATHRVVPDLPSLASQEDDPDTPQNESGTGASGPHDVSVAPDGRLYFTIGLGGDPAVRADVDEVDEDAFAALWRADADGSNPESFADLGQFEADNNPDDGVVPNSVADTNPYGVIAFETSTVVTDAGGNSLLRVDDAGDIELVAVLPPSFVPAPPFLDAPPGTRIPSEPVPTGIATAPDGAVTIGQLTGFPFQVGGASVWSVETSTAVVQASGFTNVIDVAYGPDDLLYVLEITHSGLLAGNPSGALYRVSEDGATRELLLDDLFMPGGIAFGPDDLAYITNCSVCTGGAPDAAQTGHVLRFDAVGADALVTVTNDSADTTEDMAVSIDVLANDGEGLVALVNDVANGSAVAGPGGIDYQPAAHFSGTDTIIYSACDADEEHCATGTVAVNVAASTVDRISGATRLETAVATSRAVYPGGADAVVIARADAYPDALAGAVLARVVAPPVGAPLLLTSSDTLDAPTAAEIQRLGATTAYILGGPAAISADVEQALMDDTAVQTVVRVWGSNRFETAAAIHDQIVELTGETATAVYVAEGEHVDPARGFPDVLAVSGLAAHQVRPILLVNANRLPEATANALAGVEHATIVGGAQAVSQEVEDAIADIVDETSRLAGAERYATSAAIAQAAIDAGLNPALMWLTTGQNWPDALTAGPSVAADGGVLVLVHPTDLEISAATTALLDELQPFDDVDIVGGTAAVSSDVEQGIADLLEGDAS